MRITYIDTAHQTPCLQLHCTADSSADIPAEMYRHKLAVFALAIAASFISALPFSPAEAALRKRGIFNNVALDTVRKAVREDVSNTSSSISSTTIFWSPQTSTDTEQSSVGAPLSGPPASSALGVSTVTVPWSPTATSSVSVHVITITSPWPSITPTITVSIPPSATAPWQSAPSSSVAGPRPTATNAVTVTNLPGTSTLSPALVTITVTPQQPVPEAVTVVDTTITIYISSGILTVLPTVTVTASTPEEPDVVTITIG